MTIQDVPVWLLDYAKQLHVRHPDGMWGRDLAGNDIRSYETRLRTWWGRRSIAKNRYGRVVVNLWRSLKTEGMRNPLVCVVCPETGRIRVEVGNQRLACARALRWERVPVVWAKDRKDAERVARETYT